MGSEYPFHRGEHEEAEVDASSRYLVPFVHLSIFMGVAVPFGWVIGPLCFLYTIGNRHALVHREATKLLNYTLTITIVALGVHVYGIVNGRTPDMETMWVGDQLLMMAACLLPFWAALCTHYRGKSWYPAIPFVRPPKLEPETKQRSEKRTA